MKIQYLEIVTPDVGAVCALYEELHQTSFSSAHAELGEARVAKLADGGLIGVRAPMRDTEAPIVRPYLLVDDIDSATVTAAAKGGEIAHPPLEIPGFGTFAILVQGGVHHGLWQI